MMPLYYGSRARSVPEYLVLRYDEKTRAFNALSFALMTVFSSGVSLYALAILFQTLLGWDFGLSVMLSAGIVMAYVFFGGLTSAVYNEVLQFFLIVLGLAPIVYLGLHQAGGWSGLKTDLAPEMTHAWAYLRSDHDNLMGVGLWQMLVGLGFVLSFGYWCTNFLVVQRAMIARDMSAAQRTPLLAAFPKMLLPFIVILPGLIAASLQVSGGGHFLPLKADGRIDYDMTFPSMLAHYYPTGLLGVGLTALMASFMSGMAGNVTAFNSVWTYDIYQAYLKKDGSDTHYLWMGKITTVAGILISIATAYLARSFNDIMDLLQLVFGFVNAPLLAVFLLGMFWKRTTGHGAFSGLVAGTLAALVTHGVTLAEGKGGWLVPGPFHTYRSAMGQAIAIAIVAWATCFLTAVVVSLLTRPTPSATLRGLVYGLTEKAWQAGVPWWKRPVPIAGLVLLAMIAINWLLR
jgi:solute:Na+ symporter, SSS family